MPATPVSQRSFRRRGGMLAVHQLEASSKDNPPVEVEPDVISLSPSIGQPDPFDGSARSSEVDPIEGSREVEVTMRGGVHGSSDRASGSHQIIYPRHPCTCRCTTHLCHVGTTAGDRSIEIELPESEVATEIEDRYSQPPIRRHESAPRAKDQPTLSMGGEDVEDPLNPVSTATSDEKVGQATDSESRPRSQIHALMDLGLTVLPNTPEVFFEIGRPVLHELIHLPEIWHTDCLFTW